VGSAGCAPPSPRSGCGVARVLVVDDDRALLRAMRVGLAAKGHEVSFAASGGEGLVKLAGGAAEVVVLDLGLPDLDGLEVCRQIRGWGDVPIVVLSADGLEAGGLEARKVTALDLGADDYVTEPFGMAELEARIRTALRHRSSGTDQEAGILVGDLEVDVVHHQARLGGRELELTARELELLAYLARHAGKICTHQMILGAVWGGVGWGVRRRGGVAADLRVPVAPQARRPRRAVVAHLARYRLLPVGTVGRARAFRNC